MEIDRLPGNAAAPEKEMHWLTLAIGWPLIPTVFLMV
jgi:hypothetical protein